MLFDRLPDLMSELAGRRPPEIDSSAGGRQEGAGDGQAVCRKRGNPPLIPPIPSALLSVEDLEALEAQGIPQILSGDAGSVSDFLVHRGPYHNPIDVSKALVRQQLLTTT